MELEDMRHRQIQAHDEPIGKGSFMLEDSGSDGGERTEHSGPDLPEDIWCHIHSLLPMRDAAQAACVSRAFQRSWRYRPNLTFSMKTLGVDKSACGEDEIAINFSSKVDHILKSHSCIGVKSLKIVFHYYNAKVCNVDSWLKTAVKPGIEELTVQLYAERETYYNFPWPLLADGSGSSIRYLNLASCVFSPTAGLGFRSMTRLDLCDVRITEDQLGSLLHNSFSLQRMQLFLLHNSFSLQRMQLSFLHNSFSLQRMQLSGCNEIYCLKVPFLLQQLGYLKVFECRRLQVVDSEAPNLSNFQFFGRHQIQLSLGVALQLRKVFMSCCGAVCYARADLPPCLPNVEALSLSSYGQYTNAT